MHTSQIGEASNCAGMRYCDVNKFLKTKTLAKCHLPVGGDISCEHDIAVSTQQATGKAFIHDFDLRRVSDDSEGDVIDSFGQLWRLFTLCINLLTMQALDAMRYRNL